MQIGNSNTSSSQESDYKKYGSAHLCGPGTIDASSLHFIVVTGEYLHLQKVILLSLDCLSLHSPPRKWPRKANFGFYKNKSSLTNQLCTMSVQHDVLRSFSVRVCMDTTTVDVARPSYHTLERLMSSRVRCDSTQKHV